MHQHKAIFLRKEINLIDGLALAIGASLTSAVFQAPYSMIKSNNKSIGLCLLTWMLSALINLVASLTFMELGATFPQSGGAYLYAKKSFGDVAGFLIIWSDLMILRPSQLALRTKEIVDNGLESYFGKCDKVDAKIPIMLYFACPAIFLIVNIFSVKFSLRMQDLLTLLKIGSIAFISIVAAINVSIENKFALLKDYVNFPREINYIDYSTGLLNGFIAVSGWSYLNGVLGEMKNVQSQLPIVYVFSITSSTVLHVAVNLAYFFALSPDFSDNDFPYTIYGRYYLTSFGYFMPLILSITAASCYNAIFLISTRLEITAALDGVFPDFFSFLHKNWLTPVPAMVATTLLTYIALPIPNKVLDCVISLTYLFITAFSITSAIFLRIRKPYIARPLQFPLLVHFVALGFIFVFLILEFRHKPTLSLYCLLIASMGIPFYFLYLQFTPGRFSRKLLYKITTSIKSICVARHQKQMATVDGNQYEEQEIPEMKIF